MSYARVGSFCAGGTFFCAGFILFGAGMLLLRADLDDLRAGLLPLGADLDELRAAGLFLRGGHVLYAAGFRFGRIYYFYARILVCFVQMTFYNIKSNCVNIFHYCFMSDLNCVSRTGYCTDLLIFCAITTLMRLTSHNRVIQQVIRASVALFRAASLSQLRQTIPIIQQKPEPIRAPVQV